MSRLRNQSKAVYKRISHRGKEISFEVKGQDRYGRTVGRVSVNGKDVNLELVKNGYSWHYK
ncbi:MAG: thermonuclease family protein [Planctomycetes bacterium]|uniref:thermonuclease family protein n=1 Tax=Candidatus Wunengus californicus TaxID=3367619 RepID=UPI00402A533F|nr:thermonuclease family protein [Planctomycetota bacterium]MBI4223112.1 thermonuclease family protein [Planctomycetota bacterium]